MSDKAIWGNDSYPAGEVIIPPQSILDGTAPAKVFLEYISTVDIMKVRICDYILLLHWTKGLIDALPEDVREKLYGDTGKG